MDLAPAAAPDLGAQGSTDLLLSPDEVLGTATEAVAAVAPDVHVPTICTEPVQVIGVQPDAPLAWSPDGLLLAFPSGNRSIYIASLREGGAIGVEMAIPGHSGLIKCLSFNPEVPHVLVSGGQDGLFVWDVRTGEKLLSFLTGRDGNHESDVNTLCWAYGGSTLVTGGRDDKIKVWDAMDNYRLMETITGHKAPVCSIEFNERRGKLVSAGRDSTIKVWDAQTLHPSWRERRLDDSAIIAELEENMDGHMGDVVALTITECGLWLFSGARDNTIKVWDMVNNREVRTLLGHQGDVKNMILFGEGETQMLSCALDGCCKLWQLLPPAATVEGRTDTQLIADFLQSTVDIDNTAVAAVEAVERDQVLSSSRLHEQDCFQMAYNPTHQLLATSSSMHEVKIWNAADLARPQLVHDFVGHTEQISAVSLLDAGSKMLSSSFDYHIHLYSVASVRRTARFECNGSVLTHCVSPDERLVFASGADYDITCFALAGAAEGADPRPLARFEGHSGRVHTLAISPDGALLASGGQDFNILLWKVPGKLAPGEEEQFVSAKHRLVAHEGIVMDLDFSAHSSQLLLASVANDHAVRVYSVRSGRLSPLWHTVDAHASAVAACTWGKGPSVDALFTGGWDTNIKAWDAMPHRGKTGNCVAMLKGHTARVTELVVSDDGAYLFSAAADFNAIQWEATAPYAPLCLFPGWTPDGVAMCVAVGPSTLVTGHESGVVKVWPQFGRDDETTAHLFQDNTEGASSATAPPRRSNSISSTASNRTLLPPVATSASPATSIDRESSASVEMPPVGESKE